MENLPLHKFVAKPQKSSHKTLVATNFVASSHKIDKYHGVLRETRKTIATIFVARIFVASSHKKVATKLD
jgi:hypothetical protein